MPSQQLGLEQWANIAYALCKAIRFIYLLEYVPSGLGSVKRPASWDGGHKVKLVLAPDDQFRGYATYFKRAYHERCGALFASNAPLTHP